MDKNKHILKAQFIKNDEFYTRLEDIEKELSHYEEHFKNKIIYCNCDNPKYSNFWKYFHENFERLGLKKIIATYYNKGGNSFKFEYTGGNDNDILSFLKTSLKGNGDFRNNECEEILKEVDIIVTNGPFSLFRELLMQIIENNKKFILWGNLNAINYKEIFSLIKNKQIWFGYLSNHVCYFKVPDNYKNWHKGYTEKINDGNKYARVFFVSTYTNLDISKKHKELNLKKYYYENPEKYPKYDNYNAINVDKVSDIPIDYDEIMGVPITFLCNYNLEQFEILGMTNTPICLNNDPEARQIKKYTDAIQYKNDTEIGSGNKINSGATILVDSPPINKTYYKTKKANQYLIAKYARVLIRKIQK